MAKTRTTQTTRRSKRHNNGEELAELRDAVELLQQQVSVLTQVLDKLVDELQWRNNELRERKPPAPPPTVIHSLPLDPCTDDWQINRVRPETEQPPQPDNKPTRTTLFD